MQNAFGESDENTIPIFCWKEKSKYELKEINLGLPRKKIIYTDIDKIEDYKINPENDDKVKITISGVYDDFKAFKKTKKYKLIDKYLMIIKLRNINH